jgi:peroxiredoxin
VALCLVCLGLLLIGCPSASKVQTKTNPNATQFYQMKLLKTNGAELDFRSFYGKVVILDFFATSCSRCEVLTIPLLKKLYKQHHKEGLRVVGVALQPQANIFLKPFMSQLQIPYPVVVEGKPFTKGTTVFGRVMSIPRSYLIDRCGHIKYLYAGPPKAKQITQNVQQLLKQSTNCK